MAQKFQREVMQFGKIAMLGASTKTQLRRRLESIQEWYWLSDEEYTYCVGMITDFGIQA